MDSKLLVNPRFYRPDPLPKRSVGNWPRRSLVHEDTGLKLGCTVCGYGIDWRWWPEFGVIQTGTMLTYFELGWMWYEYLCVRCADWARARGAAWNGKINFRFTGFKSGGAN